MLVFSEQDVNRDPPFSRLDLISCRNLLIYMGPELQKKLIPLFHYALNPEGVLFLGVSETIGEFTELFSALDRKAKLYQRKEALHGAQRGLLSRFLPRVPAADDESGSTPARALPAPKVQVRELTEQALLQAAPAAALVSSQGDILYLHGRTGKFLEPAPGEAGVNNILKMARKGLKRELGRALQTAAAQKTTVVHRGVRVKTNGGFTAVHLTVRPLSAAPFASEQEVPAGAAATLLFLVLLQEADLAEAVEMEAAAAPVKGKRGSAPKGGTKPGEADKRLGVLERELRVKEEHLRSVQDELERSNEAIRSSSEEMQSVNEELRCTNEELETSKEELQSVNEELATVNAELLTKVTDLSRANNDMNNLLAGTGIATIFVDHQLRILRFTPAATQIINLIGKDVGRPVGHIVSNLVGYDGLVADVQGVLDTLVPKDLEVQTKEGQWYMLRILPYRTLDNIIEGAVITLMDITEQRRAREILREDESLRRLAIVAGDANDAIIVQDMEGEILAWNPSAERLYGWSESEALKMNIRDLIIPGEQARALKRVKTISRSKTLEPYRARRIAQGGKAVEVVLTATGLRDRAGKVYAIATTEREIGRGNGKTRAK
jgi:two-component system CheB/CheR fusion protein